MSEAVSRTLIRGLTYDGSLLHSMLNHGLVLICIVALWYAGRAAPVGVRLGWLVTLLLVGAMQVGVWFVGAMGVSLVWCALAGEAVLRLHRVDAQSRRWLLAALLSSAVALVYYAITFPPVTTVAHAIAVLVGACIGAVVLRLLRARPGLGVPAD